MAVSLALLAAGCWMAIAAQPAAPATPAPAARSRTLLPVDEAAALPEFFTFRAWRLQVVARRDTAALLEIVDPDINNGFGGDDGKVAFEREWRPSSAGSTVWETLAAVSFTVLKRRDDQAPEAWTPVIAPDGRAGYISSQHVRSPIDYRAFFTKKDGRWRMVMLLAGD